MAVPTSAPCSEERIGTGFQPACCVSADASVLPAAGLGSGTSKSLATLSASSSLRAARTAGGAAAPACCLSAGLGPEAGAARVVTRGAAQAGPDSPAHQAP